MGFPVPGRGAELQPLMGLHAILPDAFAPHVHDSESELRNLVPLLRRLLCPCGSQAEVPRHTITGPVHPPQLVCGVVVALFRGLLIPPGCLRTVPRNPLTVCVHRSEVVLRRGIPLLCSSPEPARRLCEVSRSPLAAGVHVRECRLGFRIPKRGADANAIHFAAGEGGRAYERHKPNASKSPSRHGPSPRTERGARPGLVSRLRVHEARRSPAQCFAEGRLPFWRRDLETSTAQKERKNKRRGGEHPL